MNVKELQSEFRAYADEEYAEKVLRFFKTGAGQYGEGDLFLGIKVPVIRSFTKKYFRELSLSSVLVILRSRYHEERLLALHMLVAMFKCADLDRQEELYAAYLANTKYINNWDLIDCSAEHIVGAWLNNRKRNPLYTLAVSQSLWERRIAIMATFHFIKQNDFVDTLAIAEILRNDEHDLIHKPVGWMLREIGNRDLETEEKFLKIYYNKLPRTMLRYAIERFPEPLRLAYLKGEV